MFYVIIILSNYVENQKRSISVNLQVFAEKLSELLFDYKKVGRDVAKDISIGKTTIYEYLSGTKMPTLTNLIKLADYFNCSTDYLLGLEPENYELSFKTPKPFNVRFQEVLSHFKITRYKLEQLTGIAESALYYWAKGKRIPTIEKILLVCKTLDCRVDFFIGRSDLA